MRRRLDAERRPAAAAIPAIWKQRLGLHSHVVVVIQENRSFDDFFATFPGADGAIGGCMEGGSLHSMRVPRIRDASSHGCPSGDSWVRLAKVDLVEPCDFGHSYHFFTTTIAERWTVSTTRAAVKTAPQRGQGLSVRESGAGQPYWESPNNTCWPITCSKRKAAGALPRIKISSPAAR